MPSLVPTKLHMNWVNVSVTWGSTPTVLNLIGVISVNVDRGGRLEKFYGDALHMPRLIKTVELTRSISITSGDAGSYSAIPQDTPCTVSGTLLDPRNGAASGGGGFTVTLINAVLSKEGKSGENNKFAHGMISFEAYTAFDVSGNEVDPLTVVYL